MGKTINTHHLNKPDYKAMLREMKADHSKSLKDSPNKAMNPDSDVMIPSFTKASKLMEKFGSGYRGLLPSKVVLTNSKEYGRVVLGS